MKFFADIFFLLLLVASCNNRAAADGTDSETEPEDHDESYEVVTFLNFSEETIEIHWVDTSTPERTKYPAVIAAPYEQASAGTYRGHVFVYEWNGAEHSFEVQASEPRKTDPEHDDEAGEDADEEEGEDGMGLWPQIHILGDVQTEDEYLGIETKSVVCGTTEGDIRIKVKPAWSPLGAARFLELAKAETKYFDGCALNRVVPGFLTQFGIGAVYEQRTIYREASIPDDVPLDIQFEPGFMSYAGSGKDSRSSEVFIAMPDTPESQLDYFGVNSWETPFGYVEPEDLEVVARWFSYGDMEPWGKGPDPQKIYEEDGYESCRTSFQGCPTSRDVSSLPMPT